MEIKKPNVRIFKYDDIKLNHELRSDPDIATMLGNAIPTQDKYWNQQKAIAIDARYNKENNTLNVIIHVDKRHLHSFISNTQMDRSRSICGELIGYPALQQYLISNNHDIFYVLDEMDEFWYILFDVILHYCSICQSLSGIKDDDLDNVINSFECKVGIYAIIVDLLRSIMPIFFKSSEESKREPWESNPLVISYNNVSDGKNNFYLTNSVKAGIHVCLKGNDYVPKEAGILIRYFYDTDCVIGLYDNSKSFPDPMECFIDHLASLGLWQIVRTLVEYGCEICFPDPYVTRVMRNEYHRHMHKHTDALYQIYHETKHIETSFSFETE